MMSVSWRTCWYIYCLMLGALTEAEGSPLTRVPSAVFTRYSLVQPMVHHARTRREITTTKYKEDVHLPEVTMSINVNGKEHIVDLRLNKYVVSGEHTVSYQQDGNTVIHKPTREELDICQYSGTVRGVEGSWAALSTCQGIRGVIHDGEHMRYIEPAGGDRLDSPHYIYSHSDPNSNIPAGYEGVVSRVLNKNGESNTKHVDKLPRYKRDADTNYDTSEKLLEYFKANGTRYVELGVVADTREYEYAGRNESALNKRLMDIVNIANSYLTPLNIILVLVDVTVWTERDEIYVDMDSNRTLYNFKNFTENRLLKYHDLTILLTHDHFDTGVGFVGTMCEKTLSVQVLNDRFSTVVTGFILAQLVGTALGMSMDDETSQCVTTPGVMVTVVPSPLPTQWSLCSLRALKEFYDKERDMCMRNKIQPLLNTKSNAVPSRRHLPTLLLLVYLSKFC